MPPIAVRRRPVVPATPMRVRGSAVIEYSIITFFVVVVLIANPNVVSQLMQAMKDVYEAFSYALSMTYPTPD
ncbi:hypothetical protein [Marilutibacter spongiae]|uniref:Uncharacterized protein n=1 Tax=Marilutibacter spongiae TaxID=2025720 RepID=A0A7W3TPA7_9GAMM|nr:hypothetical protein [Lysobacter spongiae]MBB1061990.1 hypothetical protein [Lysobacter spongiae]